MDIFSLPILEVAVSIIICWMLFSIFCSMIHETLVQIKGERGRFLKKYILKQMYDNPNQINWGSLMYTNSNIDLLSRAYNKPSSQISPKIFSETLIETVAHSHMVQSLKATIPAVTEYKSPLLNDFAYATKVLIPSDVMTFLQGALERSRIKAVNENGIDEEKLYNVLVEEVSGWYGQLCDMTTIWYKKATKTRLFFMALIISVAINVDSVKLFEYFTDNPEARSEVLKYYAANEAYLEKMAHKYDASAGADLSVERKAELDSIKADLKVFTAKTDSLIKANKIPVGWDFSEKNAPATKDAKVAEQGSGKNSVPFWGLGFVITAFAASMGAPYWYSVLKNNPLKK